MSQSPPNNPAEAQAKPLSNSPARPPASGWGAQLNRRFEIAQERLANSPWGRQLQDASRALTGYVLPQPHLLRDEEIQLEIHQAWYRHAIPRWIWRHWLIILIITALLMIALGYFAIQLEQSLLVVLSALLFPSLVFSWATQEILRHKQWRLLITNRRTILYVPDPRSWLLVDDIRLQGGKIQVIDTKFSPSPWWGLFQTWTGARDLIISMSGYGFKANSAEVKDGLTFPDVMPEDISKLEEVVFPKKK